MAELQTPDGEQVEAARAGINADFDAAMNDDAPDSAAPPRKEPRAAPAADRPARGVKQRQSSKDEKPRTSPRGASASVALTDDQRHQGAKGIAQVTAGVAMIAAKATGNMAYAADAVTIANNTDALADACVETAKASPAFAAALDKVCAAGPYAALVAVGVSIVSQLARNHKPSLSIPGTVHPDELLAPPADAAQAEELAEAA